MLLSAGTKTAAPMSLLLCAPSGDLSSIKVFIDHKSSVGTGLLPLCTLCTGNKAPGEHCHKVKQSRGWNTTSATHSTAHTAMKKGASPLDVQTQLLGKQGHMQICIDAFART